MDKDIATYYRKPEGATQRTKYKCHKCEDTHMIIYKGADGYDYAKECECSAQAYASNRLRNSGLSEADMDKSFNDFQTPTQALRMVKFQAQDYVQKFRSIRYSKSNSMLLSGKPGKGKTLLGIAVTKDLIKSGIVALYVSYRDMITNLKQKITDENKYGQELIKYKTVDVLFIDDLFKGKLTDSDTNIMYELINYRYLKCLPIIVSTEKTEQELLNIDEALGSRIIEMCKNNIILFGDDIENHRLKE